MFVTESSSLIGADCRKIHRPKVLCELPLLRRIRPDILVKGADWRATADIIDRVSLARIGPSLGGVESLIEQPLVMSYYECTPEDRRQFGIPDNMIRYSCGIEDAEDLIADLEQALEA